MSKRRSRAKLKARPAGQKRAYQEVVLDGRAATALRMSALAKLHDLEKAEAGEGYISLNFLSRIIRDRTAAPLLRMAAGDLIPYATAIRNAKRVVRKMDNTQVGSDR